MQMGMTPKLATAGSQIIQIPEAQLNAASWWTLPKIMGNRSIEPIGLGLQTRGRQDKREDKEDNHLTQTCITPTGVEANWA